MDGIILINKEKQYTSNDVVQKLKKILNEKKIGHTGTLDPNATGLLPILLGNATKISKYLINHDKKYEVILKLGEKTDTGDGEGRPIKNVPIRDGVKLAREWPCQFNPVPNWHSFKIFYWKTKTNSSNVFSN